MSHSFDETRSKKPYPMRPATGLLAWQYTIGVLASHHSPDAMLKVQAYSHEARVMWSAVVTWGEKEESVKDRFSLASALEDLWKQLSANHQVFSTNEERVKAPDNYDSSDWLDIATQETLQRLVWVTQSVFPANWRMVVVYQPVETPNMRMMARLVANDNRIAVGGQGASLLDACRNLFRNATPYYTNPSSNPST